MPYFEAILDMLSQDPTSPIHKTVPCAFAAAMLDIAKVAPDQLASGVTMLRIDFDGLSPDPLDAIKFFMQHAVFGGRQEISFTENKYIASPKNYFITTDLQVIKYGWFPIAYQSGATIVFIGYKEISFRRNILARYVDRTFYLENPYTTKLIESVIRIVTGHDMKIDPRYMDGFDYSDLLLLIRPGMTQKEIQQRHKVLYLLRIADGDVPRQTKEEEKPNAVEKPLISKDTESKIPKRSPSDPAPTNIDGHPKLSDMPGFGPAREWGLQLCQDIADYAAKKLTWADLDRGALLSGPPGCGKTTFARALAAEAGIPLYMSSFSTLSAGGWNIEKPLKKIFDEARNNAPSIVFMDELDSVPGRDQKTDHNSTYFNAVNNAFLEQLDGAVSREGVIVIAASNFPEKIDSALRRPGRLDRHIEIPLPDQAALEGIIRHHLGPDAVIEADELSQAARDCRGKSPADVEQLCREARRMCRTTLKRRPGAEDVSFALRLRRPPISRDAERNIARHESGHAVVAWRLGKRVNHIDLTNWVTNVHFDGGIRTRRDIMTEITVCLGGRAADCMYGEATTGAGHDLTVATNAAANLHMSHGLGCLGLVVSPDTMPMTPTIMAAVKATLDEAYATAQAILERDRAIVDRVVERLMATGYLTGAEFLAVVREPDTPEEEGCPEVR